MCRPTRLWSATKSRSASGYFFFQIPGAIYAERKSAVRLVFWSLILWGALASLQGLLHSATWLIVVRFGVGVVEAAVLQPGAG